MKQLKAFITRLFIKRKSLSSLFADAWEEGIRDTLKELGYRTDKNIKKS